MQDFASLLEVINTNSGKVSLYSLPRFTSPRMMAVEKMPYSIRILLENVIRNSLRFPEMASDAEKIARWHALAGKAEIAFCPARVLLQDFTGVPAVVDLAALRSALARAGGDPSRINPSIPVDLVIDHSVQVDQAGSGQALSFNLRREYERNRERYELLRWAVVAFDNFRIVPPSMGIVHQVNLEYLASVVMTSTMGEMRVAFPDSLVGTDSHTTMINGLGVLGWGVGGIEAEYAMIGQPISIMLPEVVGVRFSGELNKGVTATDLVLTVTEKLRKLNVVGKFVEYFGPGLESLSLADRTTIANMAPEYGATLGFFPVSQATLDYLKLTGRDEDQIDLVERYSKEQGLFFTGTSPEPVYSLVEEINLSEVVPSIAGPKRPQDRIALSEAAHSFRKLRKNLRNELGEQNVDLSLEGEEAVLRDGSIVIAAITSCTNTSNPEVMIAAGLIAKNAIERGLSVPPYVKTSLAPGSRVVTRYLDKAGLTPFLEALGFHTVGYGCTTCIGNSGPLDPQIERAIREKKLIVAAVLSGNRNFEGRVHPLTTANYLASPPLVVAYALAGRMDLDLTSDPLGFDQEGRAVTLADLWPDPELVDSTIASFIGAEDFEKEYSQIFRGNAEWNSIPAAGGALYDWDSESTYIQEPPFFLNISRLKPVLSSIISARVLAFLGDSVTTDHISPAGQVPYNSPAADYLRGRGVNPDEFNSFGSRRGNHEVMMRGTLGNIRLRNRLVPDVEGGVTRYLGDGGNGEVMTIFDAAMKYRQNKTPLIILAGKEYGTGSSRDWAAKGVQLLGVRAVIAKSFERIHRSNLVGMGVIPLQFLPGESAEGLGLTGEEEYTIRLDESTVTPGQEITVEAGFPGEEPKVFSVKLRIDSQVELEYLRNGGILHAALRDLLRSEG